MTLVGMGQEERLCKHGFQRDYSNGSPGCQGHVWGQGSTRGPYLGWPGPHSGGARLRQHVVRLLYSHYLQGGGLKWPISR